MAVTPQIGSKSNPGLLALAARAADKLIAKPLKRLGTFYLPSLSFKANMRFEQKGRVLTWRPVAADFE